MAAVYVSGGRLNTVSRVGTVDSMNRLGEVGVINEIRDVQIKSLPCPRVNNKGMIEAWSWSKVGSIAIAIASAKVSYEAANNRYKIAKRYWQLAKSEWEDFYDNYRPLEKKELAEIKAENKPTVDYIGALHGHTQSIEPIFNNLNNFRADLASKFCVCPDKDIASQFLLAKSTVYGDLDNFSRRYAEDLQQRRDDIRWNKRTQAANRGRSLVSQSTSFANKAQSFYAEYSDAMTSVAQGAAKFAGRLDKRRDTEYNAPRTAEVASRRDYTGATGIPTVDGQKHDGVYFDDVYSSQNVSGIGGGQEPLAPISFDPTGMSSAFGNT